MSSNVHDFVKALKQIREDPAMSQKFLQDPHGTLKTLGVEVGKQASTASSGVAPLGICVGACICVG